jgi:hypothetical protein
MSHPEQKGGLMPAEIVSQHGKNEKTEDVLKETKATSDNVAKEQQSLEEPKELTDSELEKKPTSVKPTKKSRRLAWKEAKAAKKTEAAKKAEEDGPKDGIFKNFFVRP